MVGEGWKMIKLDRKIWNHKTGIYFIKCLISNKVYIGSATNIYKRINDHRLMLERNKHHCIHLQRSYNKNGVNNFECGVICECLVTEKKEKEEYWINHYHKLNLLFNMTLCYKGNHGMVISEETRLKISKSQTGKTAYNKGKKMEEDQVMLLRKINVEKYGKLIDVYNLNGELIESILGIGNVIRKYNFDKKHAQSNLQGKIPRIRNYVLRYHEEPFENKLTYKIRDFLRTEKIKAIIWDKILNGEDVLTKKISRELKFPFISITRIAIKYIYFIAVLNKINPESLDISQEY